MNHKLQSFVSTLKMSSSLLLLSVATTLTLYNRLHIIKKSNSLQWYLLMRTNSTLNINSSKRIFSKTSALKYTCCTLSAVLQTSYTWNRRWRAPHYLTSWIFCSISLVSSRQCASSKNNYNTLYLFMILNSSFTDVSSALSKLLANIKISSKILLTKQSITSVRQLKLSSTMFPSWTNMSSMVKYLKQSMLLNRISNKH